MVEDVECLCHMMKTVGRRLDHDKAKVSVAIATCACAKSVLSVERHGLHTMYMVVISRMVDQYSCVSTGVGGPVF